MSIEEWFSSRANSKFKDVSTEKVLVHEPPEGIVVPRGNKFGKGNIYQNTKGGYVPSLGITVRSAWEKKFMLILKSYNIAFEYEQYIYNFPAGKGAKFYLPDLWLPSNSYGELVEVKGYWDNASKQKLRKLSKYFPKDFSVLTVVTSKYSKAGLAFCAKIKVPNVLYWEEIEKVYKPIIREWN